MNAQNALVVPTGLMNQLAAVSLAFGMAAFTMPCSAQRPQHSVAGGKFAPRGKRRLIVTHDPAQMWEPLTRATLCHLHASFANDPSRWKKAVESLVHAHADAGVDTFVHCVFSRFGTTMPDARTAEPVYNQLRKTVPLKKFQEAGYDVVQIMLDQTHRDGMTFMAGLRMNDRHGISHTPQVHDGVSYVARMWQEKVEWRLEGVPGGFDYSKKPVREAMLAFIEEVLKRYDVDGVEFDYLRFILIFPKGTEQENAPLLTDFHQRTRELLDKASAKRGRRLLLGVRVPNTLAECRTYGYDVKAWIDQNVVDYIVPSQFGYMEVNRPVEPFRELTEGTEVRVYPSLNLWAGPCRFLTVESGLWRPEHYRAAARNFYAFGADGIATYNYLPSKPQYAAFSVVLERLSALSPMVNPGILAGYDRDYLFSKRAHTVIQPRYDVIHLDRAASHPRGTFRFRIAEDLRDASAVLEFKAVGITDSEVLVIELNGAGVPGDRVSRFHIWDGHDHEGRPEPYDLYRFRLDQDMVVFGDNELGVRLAQTDQREGVIEIQEVNVKVHVGL